MDDAPKKFLLGYNPFTKQPWTEEEFQRLEMSLKTGEGLVVRLDGQEMIIPFASEQGKRLGDDQS